MSLIPNLPLCTHRYVLFVSYLGTRYNGSQRLLARDKQGGFQDTIQEALECSLESFLPIKRCRLTTSSRTDKGVHALTNCYTLPLMADTIPTEKMKRLSNENLIRKGHDILVNEVILAPANFHPRKDAISREYIYRIAVMNSQRASSLRKSHTPIGLMHKLPVTELFRVLPLPCFDTDKALEAINLLSGEHDFAAFALKPKEEDTVRSLEITMTQVETDGIDSHRTYPYSLYQLHFKSKSFLHNQIRRLTGAIISYASYNLITIDRISQLLEKPDTTNWTYEILVAEPYGLFLSRINYARSIFAGSIKTFEDKTQEEIDDLLASTAIEMSDDECVEQGQAPSNRYQV